jgi:hypothetical protein
MFGGVLIGVGALMLVVGFVVAYVSRRNTA